MDLEPLDLFRKVTAELTDPGAPFEIQNRDVPEKRLFAGTPPNFNTLMTRARSQFGSRDFLHYQGRRMSFEDIFVQSDSFAAALTTRYGIVAGDRVGIAMRNRPEWFVAYLAIARLGAIGVMLNSRGASEEIAWAADHVGSKLVIADDERAAGLADEMNCPALDEAGFAALIENADIADLPDMPDPDLNDPAIILFTSGTTGRPKGAIMMQRNLCTMAREMELRGELGLATNAQRYGMKVEDMRAMVPPMSMLLIFPMFHISGITIMCSALISGGLITLMRRWDPEEAVELIEVNQVGAISAPSMVYIDLLALPNAQKRLVSLRSTSIGGQATPEALAVRIRETIPGAGLVGSWGQTETTGAATGVPAEVFAVHPGTVGQPSSILDLRVVDADGKVLAPHEVGEFEARGPIVMKGYWNDEQATADAFRNGWLRTGDLGWYDEKGLFYIADRAKDMVISAGENIYCAEVERVLSMIEDQSEVALFGVADDRLGERAIAAVVMHDGAGRIPDPNGVCDHVRSHLADYKVPSEIRFDLGPLPRNAVGKVDKLALAHRYHERSET
ncbi:MAG: class I adenylate-forming enzyme family protein [Novosphingobium sp.]|nr:class I adenylate-forming enzyme family protein [Novosphingobium sp.]